MTRSIKLMAITSLVILLAFATSGLAQVSLPGAPHTITKTVQSTSLHMPNAPGTLFIPKSSVPQNPPAGHKFAAHTNVQVFVPSGVSPDEYPPFPGYGFETPASAACHYGLVSTTAAPNCNPNATNVNPSGGSQSIAIVDAYDDPSAPGDLAWFSVQFGIPLELSEFQVVWANPAASSCPVNLGYGVPTDFSGGWEIEESLDIEWAHAMSPEAKLYLVEACSNYDFDLQQAVLVANNLVQCGQSGINPTTGALTKCTGTGKGEVSMSWGGMEFAGENGSTACATLDDSCFTAPGVVYFASSGDGPGVIWPGSSPKVVSAGGTTNRRSPSTFNFIQEAAWVDGGGGLSAIEAKPSFQNVVIPLKAINFRAVPDLSFDSDPHTGVYVYDTFPISGLNYYEWLVVGGTSAASPSLAGIVNRAGGFAASSNAELTTIYNNRLTTSDFTDVAAGFCGFYMGFSAVTGWDYCTGVGVDKGYVGK
ncbi:MAG TPA: hypothetical protein VG028_02670 [Terriglobia bacterium]|nr:hypothetical protein [Terriglobia bacterium]